MLVRLWGKWNPQMQLVGVKNGTPRLENRFEVFNEVPHSLSRWVSHSIPMYLPKSHESYMYTYACIHMLITTLIITANYWQ